MLRATILVIITATLALLSSANRDGPHDAVIRALYRDVQSAQWQDDKPYQWPITFGHEKGKYANNIHINFVGALGKELRSALSFPDNNGFVTIFVLDGVLQAGLYAPDLIALNDTSSVMALRAIVGDRDHNVKDPQMPIFGFWPQILTQTAHGSYWEQWSINLSAASLGGEVFDAICKALLDKANLAWLYDLVLAPFTSIFQNILTMFNIPSDTDDTGNIVALSRWFARRSVAAQLPETVAFWNGQLFNESLAFLRLAHDTSYCPKSRRNSSSTIDSRTWVWAHPFLMNLTTEEDCVVTTWIMNLDEQISRFENTSVGAMMPFNVNNVDPTVACNVLYGMAVSLIEGDSSWFRNDRKARKLFETTGRFVAWTLRHQSGIKRTDLELLYYPAVMNFPLFVARLARYLTDTKASRGSLGFPALDALLADLRDAIETSGSAFVLNAATSGVNCTRGDAAVANSSVVCWTSFLGMADTTWNGTKTPHYDDRYYTTATACNALLEMWTQESANGTTDGGASVGLTWRSNTPPEVKSALRGAADWLTHAYLDPSTPFENTFFSGSIHNISSLPFFTPPNVIEQLNNQTWYTCADTSFANDMLGDNTLWAIRGVPDQADYNRMVQRGTCAGATIDISNDIGSYNAPISPWPFWSSPALTKAVALSALSKYRAATLSHSAL